MRHSIFEVKINRYICLQSSFVYFKAWFVKINRDINKDTTSETTSFFYIFKIFHSKPTQGKNVSSSSIITSSSHLSVFFY